MTVAVFVVALVAFAVSAFALWAALVGSVDWLCERCGRPRFRRDAEGYRRCDRCQFGWKTERAA